MSGTNHLGGAWRGALLPVGALALMEIASRVGSSTSDSFAAPSAIFYAFGEALADGTLAVGTKGTLVSAGSGLGIGIAIGLVAGMVFGLFPRLGKAFDLLIEFLRPMPSIALIPIGMLVFGLGYALEISTVAFACTWPMLILSRAAIAGVEPQLIELAQTLELPLLARVRKIVLPSILPHIFVAIRLSMTLAIIVGITVEIAANPIGLGYQMMMSQQSVRPDLMYALLFWIAFLGWLVNYVMKHVELYFFGRMGGAQ
jgi:ABC-type nitrate/sulfonate/bicarbonate transport system permease component